MQWLGWTVAWLASALMGGLIAALVIKVVRDRQARQQVVAHQLYVINQAVQALVTNREPTHAEIGAWLAKRNLWCGSVGDMVHHLAQQGYVVVTAQQWASLVQHIGPTGMSVQEWLNRDNRDGS